MPMKKILLVVLASVLAVNAGAWSGPEHKWMAYMAEQHLTPNTQKFLQRYLDQSIEGYAVWMDRYRDAPGYEQTTNWHMISIDDDWQPTMSDKKGLMIEPLEHAVDVLAHYKDYNDSTVFISLVEIIHLIPELHCPSHYRYFTRSAQTKAALNGCVFTDDKGKSTNHHTLWDSSISYIHPGMKEHKVINTFDTWTKEQQDAVCVGTPRDWIVDNAKRIWQIYSWPKPGKVSRAEYLAEHAEFTDNQFRMAAYRLAYLLNSLFDKEVTE